MPSIAAPDLPFLLSKMHLFRVEYENQFRQCFSRLFAMHHFLPEELQKILAEITELNNRLQAAAAIPMKVDITEAEAALLRQVILKSRLREARSSEENSLKTFQGELLDQFWSGVKNYDAMMNQEWFRQAADRTLPKLSDFVPIEYAQTPAWQLPNTAQKEREFDEKFHILQAPTSFISDLDEFREASELRALSFAVAFIDIDNFKNFNTKYTETVVDREVLPVLMRCMESHFYKRGYAYRQGGDEYLALIYNTPESEAIKFIETLRKNVEQLRYRSVEGGLTISIGLVCSDGECHLTSREVEAKASKAKALAKEKGRNCIATYQGRLLEESELYVVGTG